MPHGLIGGPWWYSAITQASAIARSEEAKALGIEMGTPAFLLEPQIKKHNIAVFSSNYTLYGDMSDRVMKLLGGFVPNIEIYSIDETFLDLHSMPFANLLELGMNKRNTVRRHTGILPPWASQPQRHWPRWPTATP